LILSILQLPIFANTDQASLLRMVTDLVPAPQRGSVTLWGPWVFCFGIAFWFAPASEPVIWLAPALFLVALSLLFGLMRLCFTQVRLIFFVTMICAFLFGLVVAEIRSFAQSTPILPAQSNSWMVTGELHRIDRETKSRARYLIRVTQIEGLTPEEYPKFVRVGGWRSPAEVGALVRFRATLQPPQSVMVPGGFSFARNAWFQQIGGTGFTLGHLEIINPAAHVSVQLHINRFRYGLAKTIRERVPGNSGAVAAALVTGDRSAISPKQVSAYREAGLGHLMAISGLHMSLVGGLAFLVASIIFAMIPAIGARMDARKPAAIFGLCVAASYLLVSGAAAPTQRAFIMLSLIFLAVLLNRKALSIRTISVAAFVVALISPEYVASAGFQMSFAASLALIAVYQRAGRFFGEQKSMQKIDGPIVRFVRGLSIFIIGILLTSLVAGIATAPFASWHFHKIAVYSLLGNLLAMPVFTILVMPFLLIGMCLLPLGLDGPFMWVAGFGLDVIASISTMTASLPGAIYGVPSASPITLLLEAVALILLCIGFSRFKYIALLLVLVAFAFRLQVSTPVIWSTDDGGAFILPNGPSNQIITFGSPSKFALRQFTQSVGLSKPDIQKIETLPQAKCDQNGCGIRIADKLISIRNFTDDIETDCQLADLVIIRFPLLSRQQPSCADTELLILSENKGTVVYFNKNKWITQKPNHDRLWDRAGAL